MDIVQELNDLTVEEQVEELVLHLKGECDQVCLYCYDEYQVRIDNDGDIEGLLLHEEYLRREWEALCI